MVCRLDLDWMGFEFGLPPYSVRWALFVGLLITNHKKLVLEMRVLRVGRGRLRPRN